MNVYYELVTHELQLHESKFPFVSRIEFIRSKLSNFSAHVYGVNEPQICRHIDSTRSNNSIQKSRAEKQLLSTGASPTGDRGVLTIALLKTGRVDPPDSKMKWPKWSGVFFQFFGYFGVGWPFCRRFDPPTQKSVATPLTQQLRNAHQCRQKLVHSMSAPLGVVRFGKRQRMSRYGGIKSEERRSS